MQDAGKLARLAIGIGVAVAAAACAFPASASSPRTVQGQPSAAAVGAWSASYRAQEKAYEEQQAGRTPLLSQATVQAWSDSYRAREDVYQRQQLAAAEREATAFHLDDAVIGGGIVLALTALIAGGVYVLRSRRLAPAS